MRMPRISAKGTMLLRKWEASLPLGMGLNLHDPKLWQDPSFEAKGPRIGA